MSSLIFICNRSTKPSTISVADVERAGRLLMPCNIDGNGATTVAANDVILSIVNPTMKLNSNATSVCLGQLYETSTQWWKIGGEAPVGSYAICRCDQNNIELLSDAVGSRTIWYYFDPNVLIASTSQRAIVALLGSFELDRRCVSWLLSSGTLGPNASWDRRIQRLNCNSRLHLDRVQWSLDVCEQEIIFRPTSRSAADFEADLTTAISQACEALPSTSEWRLPLSGGYDSRALLLFLSRVRQVKCITWGVESAAKEIGSDAYIAAQLADEMGVSHEYFATDRNHDISPKSVLERFVDIGEGRVDHISGYLDGFEMWKTFFNNEISGIIRGDSGFGCRRFRGEFDVRQAVGATLLTDYFTDQQLKSFELPEQVFPDSLARRADESLPTWADRLMFEYRTPIVKAALSDLRTKYVETASPLLSHNIVRTMTQTPDQFRLEKNLFRNLVEKTSPPIPFATLDAIADARFVLSRRGYVEVIRDELSSTHAGDVMSNKLLDFILQTFHATQTGSQDRRPLRHKIKQHLPEPIVSLIRRIVPNNRLFPSTLAFRAYIASSMTKRLAIDASANYANVGSGPVRTPSRGHNSLAN